MLIIKMSNCINTASGIVTLCKWPSGAPDGHLQRVKISRFVFHRSRPGWTRAVPCGQTEEHGEAVIRYSLSGRPKNVVPQAFTSFAF